MCVGQYINKYISSTYEQVPQDIIAEIHGPVAFPRLFASVGQRYEVQILLLNIHFVKLDRVPAEGRLFHSNNLKTKTNKFNYLIKNKFIWKGINKMYK